MPGLLICSASLRLDAALVTALGRGNGRGIPPCTELQEFRRDLIASDPDWIAMTLLPRPGDPMADRYLMVGFHQPPPRDQVRDLRYVAARHGLQLVELP